MHPVLVLVPAAALILGPRLWVNHVLQHYNRRDENLACTAGELARELLDRHQLHGVRVESTDIGDHYDPRARAVRLGRDRIDRKSLTAITTAAHEVAHALQHAADYGPFIWRTRLVRIARVAGEAGFILLLAVPLTAVATRRPVPPFIVGVGALIMLGTGVATQLAALPSELDASFGRALPLLEEGYISGEQLADAGKILMACSLTYIAASLISIVNIWPWLGRPAAAGAALITPGLAGGTQQRPATAGPGRRTRRKPPSIAAALVRRLGKPLIREVLRYSRRNTAGHTNVS
ncbi:MAG: zinc metallopeptidase [Gammaproteobacteria bacterium]|jgi:Zn-dependent membrane protease YugP